MGAESVAIVIGSMCVWVLTGFVAAISKCNIGFLFYIMSAISMAYLFTKLFV